MAAKNRGVDVALKLDKLESAGKTTHHGRAWGLVLLGFAGMSKSSSHVPFLNGIQEVVRSICSYRTPDR